MPHRRTLAPAAKTAQNLGTRRLVRLLLARLPEDRPVRQIDVDKLLEWRGAERVEGFDYQWRIGNRTFHVRATRRGTVRAIRTS